MMLSDRVLSGRLCKTELHASYFFPGSHAVEPLDAQGVLCQRVSIHNLEVGKRWSTNIKIIHGTDGEFV